MVKNYNQQIVEQLKKGVRPETLMEEYKMNWRILQNTLSCLDQMGYHLHPLIQTDGNVYYTLNTLPFDQISLVPVEKKLRFIAISDTHYCGGLEDIRLLKDVYSYARKEGIHIILHLGDVIEGEVHSKTPLEEQLMCVSTQYLCDPDIINVILFGNHDYYTLKTSGFDMARALTNTRKDFINAKYGTAILNIGQNKMKLHHKIEGIQNPLDFIKTDLTLHGHSHIYRVDYREKISYCRTSIDPIRTENCLDIHVPPLSYIPAGSLGLYTGFLDFTLTFKETMDGLELQHLASNYLRYKIPRPTQYETADILHCDFPLRNVKQKTKKRF